MRQRNKPKQKNKSARKANHMQTAKLRSSISSKNISRPYTEIVPWNSHIHSISTKTYFQRGIDEMSSERVESARQTHSPGRKGSGQMDSADRQTPIAPNTRSEAPAPKSVSVAPTPSPTTRPNKHLLMMQFMLDGCSTEEIARVFNISLDAATRITTSELFRSGLARLKEQADFEMRAGLTGAAQEAFSTVKMIMRNAKSDSTRLRAAQYFLEVAGFHTSPSHHTAVGVGIDQRRQTINGTTVNGNVTANTVLDIGDIVQRAMDVATKNRAAIGEIRKLEERDRDGVDSAPVPTFSSQQVDNLLDQIEDKPDGT